MVHFKNVFKTYKKDLFKNNSVAVSDLTFSLSAGETLGLIGANGAGKSTSLRMLLDFIRPDSGYIELFGGTPRNHLLRKKVGYLPETANFPKNLNVLDLLRFAGATSNLSMRNLNERTEKLLSLLKLWEVRSRPLRTYSKGMQQRANFAIALINNPDLLILDEPMSGLDPMGRASIIELILELKKEGKTILFCSHILEDVDRLVDNILLLHEGQKLFQGLPQKLVAQENANSISDAFMNRVNGGNL